MYPLPCGQQPRMNYKALIVLVSVLIYSCECAQLSPRDSIESIDRSLLVGLYGEESLIARDLIFNARKKVLKIDLENIVNHLFECVSTGKGIEVISEEQFQTLIQVLTEAQNAQLAQLKVARKSMKELTDLRATLWGFNRAKLVDTENKIHQVSKSIKAIEIRILKLEAILQYCNDEEIPHHVVKSELSKDTPKITGYIPRQRHNPVELNKKMK